MLPAKQNQVYRVNYKVHYPEKYNYNFQADSKHDVLGIVAALSAYFSGDDCECFINGEKAILEGDWGLL